MESETTYERNEIERAIKHARAGLKALEEALSHLDRNLQVYPTHLYVAGVELAAATEFALAVGLRSQAPAPSVSQNR
jgi:uncharacterized membrane protein YjjP (DUF1212 family)